MKKVLLVDNHAGFRASIEKYFIIGGMSVVQAENGTEALRILREETIDIILTDMNMPEMTGLELIALIKTEKRWCSIPIFLLSVSENPAVVSRAMEAGAAGFLQKPFSLDEFLELARNHVPGL